MSAIPRSIRQFVRAAVCPLMAVVLVAGCGLHGGPDAGSSAPAGDAIDSIAEKGPVKLQVRVTPREPRLSDLVEMEVTVESQPDVEIKPPAFGQAVGDFLIRDYSERPPPAGVRNVRRFHYQLEPAHAGKHLIRAVSIEFVDRRPNSEGNGEPLLIETDPIEVNVTSELGDATPNLANLEAMLPPEALPESVWAGWWAIAAVVVTAVAIIAVRRRRKARLIEPRRETAEEVAHAALAALLAENLPAMGLFKEFYLRLTGIVRHYIEDTTGLRAPEQTTEEFLRDMRSHAVFPMQRSIRLAEFLEAADMVKYAGQQPGDGQIAEATCRAREFVDRQQDPAPAAHRQPVAMGSQT